jgi:hypothetical protein
MKSSKATCFSAWFLTSGLPHAGQALSGHVLQRVVPDFQPEH